MSGRWALGAGARQAAAQKAKCENNEDQKMKRPNDHYVVPAVAEARGVRPSGLLPVSASN